jgi:hypothetical protein
MQKKSMTMNHKSPMILEKTKKTLPLYLTFVDGRLVRCLKPGIVNWGNTQWYDIMDLEIISISQGRTIHIIKLMEYKDMRGLKESFFKNLANNKWHYIPNQK